MKINLQNYPRFNSVADRIAYKKRQLELHRQADYDTALSAAIGYIIPAICIGLLVGLILFISSCSTAYAESINKKEAVRAIIGEASSDGLEGMRAVASAIRNRGHLRGVYGLKAKHVNKEPAWVWKLAEQAWEDSKHKDFANGADHWEGTAFKTPYWAKSMVLVKKVKNQIFYRSRKAEGK